MSNTPTQNEMKTRLYQPGALEGLLIEERLAYRSSVSSARNALYIHLSKTAALAQIVREDAQLFTSFRALQMWSHMEEKPPAAGDFDVLKFMLTAIEGDDNAALKRVSKQLIALRGLLDEGIQPSDFVAEFNKRGGFSAVVRGFAKPSVRSSPKPIVLKFPPGMFQSDRPAICIVTLSGESRQTRVDLLDRVAEGIAMPCCQCLLAT